jgi:hypothetical protein
MAEVGINVKDKGVICSLGEMTTQMIPEGLVLGLRKESLAHLIAIARIRCCPNPNAGNCTVFLRHFVKQDDFVEFQSVPGNLL